MGVWHSETEPFVVINIQTLIESRLKQSCRSCDVRLICHGEQKVGSLRSPKLQKQSCAPNTAVTHIYMRRTHTHLPRARHCSTKETRASYHTPAPPREAFVVRLIPHRNVGGQSNHKSSFNPQPLGRYHPPPPYQKLCAVSPFPS